MQQPNTYLMRKFIQLWLIIDQEPPTFYDLFTIYNAFNIGFTVRDVNEIHAPHEKNIDIKYF